VKSDTPARAARTSATLTRPRTADRLGRARPGSWRSRRLSSLARRAARHRHPPGLTTARREVTTKPPGGRTRSNSAPTEEKCHSRGSPKAIHDPTMETGEHASADQTPRFSRESVADVRLTGLSFYPSCAADFDKSESRRARKKPRCPCTPEAQARETAGDSVAAPLVPRAAFLQRRVEFVQQSEPPLG
jgi:hypothetical protein